MIRYLDDALDKARHFILRDFSAIASTLATYMNREILRPAIEFLCIRKCP
jgi:hypothetical protein